MAEQKQITQEQLVPYQARVDCYLIYRYDARYSPPKFVGSLRDYDWYDNSWNLTFPTAEAAQAYIDTHYEYQVPTPFPPKRPWTAQEREEYRRLREEERQEREQILEELHQEVERESQAIIAARHPAFAGYGTYLDSHESAREALRARIDPDTLGILDDTPATNEECLFFCLEQIGKVGKQYQEGATRQEIRRIYADVKARGGDAWAEHKARMQQLTK